MILNKTKSHSDRYKILPGSMGGYGEPKNHANNHFQIVSGIDRGNGYQGYMSVSYFTQSEYADLTAKKNCLKFLKDAGFNTTTLLKET